MISFPYETGLQSLQFDLKKKKKKFSDACMHSQVYLFIYFIIFIYALLLKVY